jgi:exosome complex RNA-binding protein Csl4
MNTVHALVVAALENVHWPADRVADLASILEYVVHVEVAADLNDLPNHASVVKARVKRLGQNAAVAMVQVISSPQYRKRAASAMARGAIRRRAISAMERGSSS